MLAILMEGLLFVALIAACGTLVLFVIAEYTPFGKRLREVRNRRAIERAAELTCPIHGAFPEEEMVQDRWPRQGEPDRGRSASQSQSPIGRKRHSDVGAMKDGEAVEWPDAAGLERGDPDDSAAADGKTVAPRWPDERRTHET